MLNIDLLSLIGEWSGKGTAQLHGSGITHYSDYLSFEYIASKDLIFYTQRTKYDMPGKENEVLHVESGFIKESDDGITEISNSQNNGRVEVMILDSINKTGEEVTLRFVSKLFGNDPRMLETMREFNITNDTLAYEMKMATQMNNSLTTHLKSVLTKKNELQ